MINEYNFGRIVINKKEYTNDVIILDSKIIEWWRGEDHHAKVPDFKDIPDNTEVLVIGTGASGVMKIDPSVLDYFKEKKIRVIAEMTEEAVHVFNKLKEQKNNAKILVNHGEVVPLLKKPKRK